MGQEDLLDLARQGGTPLMDPPELDRPFGDHAADGRLGRKHNGLRVERGQDGFGELAGQAWGPGPNGRARRLTPWPPPGC